MLTKTISIDGKEVAFRASAAVPRLYRIKFRRDIYADLRKLDTAIKSNDAENSGLDTFSLELFENIAFIMAKHADKSIPDSVEDWLDEFDTFSIYKILPELLELWGMNVETQVETKKK